MAGLNGHPSPNTKTKKPAGKRAKAKASGAPHPKQKTPSTPIRDKYLDRGFWDLVNSGNISKDTYTQLLKKHESKGGDIIRYLKKICKNSASFEKFKKIPEIDRKNAKTLTEIDIN